MPTTSPYLWPMGPPHRSTKRRGPARGRRRPQVREVKPGKPGFLISRPPWARRHGGPSATLLGLDLDSALRNGFERQCSDGGPTLIDDLSPLARERYGGGSWRSETESF